MDYVTGLLEETGKNVLPLEVNYTIEFRINKFADKYPETLVFCLNEVMQDDNSNNIFTMEVIEKAQMMHTGPSSDTLVRD